jgi:hypothetical protein
MPAVGGMPSALPDIHRYEYAADGSDSDNNPELHRNPCSPAFAFAYDHRKMKADGSNIKTSYKDWFVLFIGWFPCHPSHTMEIKMHGIPLD